MSTDAIWALAPYAVSSSGGRVHSEPADPVRGPLALDRHRIINSTAFRRLDGKTQVFGPQTHDHFRNRLEHTLEVASVARTLARALRANEALAEAITLAHDLGHPPFGHAGEAALNEVMAAHGGFNHNAHSLRVVEYLEHPYPAFRGLNLTRETLDGLRWHETQFDRPENLPSGPPPVWESVPLTDERVPLLCEQRSDGKAAGRPSVEAQIASLADRIAYDCHDLEDAIGAAFITADDLQQLELWRAARDQSGSARADAVHVIRRAVLDAMLNALLLDAAQTSLPLLALIRSADEARSTRVPLVRLSETMNLRLAELEGLLIEHVYRRAEITAADAGGRQMIRELFTAYRRSPRELPDRFFSRISEQSLERVICDYIAGMTDRFCAREHGRIAAVGL